jgi:hypothetical protein
MTARRAKKKSKQKDLYELIVVDMREGNTEQVEELRPVEEPEQLEQTKPPKVEITFTLGAEVGLVLPGTGLEKLGRILRITSQLLTVKWDDGSGTLEQFSRTGYSFYGKVNSVGEPAKPHEEEQKMWGTDEDPHLIYPTDDEKQALTEKRNLNQ